MYITPRLKENCDREATLGLVEEMEPLVLALLMQSDKKHPGVLMSIEREAEISSDRTAIKETKLLN